MTRLNWKRTLIWTPLSLALVALALMIAPVPAFGQVADVVLYELTEDMYLKDGAGNIVTDPTTATRRTAVAQLSGWAKLGTPLCPSEVLFAVPTAKACTVNATGADDISLTTGRGTLSGVYSVVVQGDNSVDAPEFVVMTGTFKGDADLSPAFANVAPLGFIANGVATIDGLAGAQFAFGGKFRLPFALNTYGAKAKPRRHYAAYYLGDDGVPLQLLARERALGFPTVRIEINFQ